MEIWKDIQGWDGKYQISSFGRLKSLGGKFKVSMPEGYITNGSLDSSGYLCVTLRKPGKRFCVRIHTLVADAFIPNPQNKPQVNHIDGIKTNNYIGNLERVTNKENSEHAIKMGLTNNRGENHGMSKVSEKDVLKMREMRANGLFLKEIASIFGISSRQAGDICNRKNWGWL